MNNKQIKQIVILGGGSAGWLSAGLIAAEHCQSPDSEVTVTLVESPDIPIIGVGEGTWPSMRSTLKKIGLDETDLFKECDAAFKQGAKFAKWVTGAEDDFYYHPLVLPNGFHDADLASAWLSDSAQMSFADAVCAQSHICEQGLAPKQITTPEYAAVANYAYHLDAVKLGQMLQRHCTTKLNVKHVLDHVVEVKSCENGDIAALVTKSNGELQGDLFIDCSGMASRLLGQHYGIDFVSTKDSLFNDNAIAVQVPYVNETDDIASHTISTAHQAGWIWDIGLPTRKGTGIVYASEHMSQDEAQSILQNYAATSVGEKASKELNYRHIPINPGHRQTFWHRNCVAIGLSAGFLEPLEASALVLVESSAGMVAEDLPANREVMDLIADRFNKRVHHYWHTIVDFLKLHYVLSQRDDSEYWRAHRNLEGVSDTLKDSLKLWKTQIPNQYDFPLIQEMFPAASWQYVLYGMGFKTNLTGSMLSEQKQAHARQFIQQSLDYTKRCLSLLPKNRELIDKIRQYGMQKV